MFTVVLLITLGKRIIGCFCDKIVLPWGNGTDCKSAPAGESVALALSYTNHILSTKNLLAILSDGSRFNIDSNFQQLKPVYKVSVSDIEEFIKDIIKTTFK